MDTKTLHHPIDVDLGNAAAKASIAVGGATYSWFETLPLSDLVALATLIFVLFQIVVITPKVFSTVKAGICKVFRC